jgi:hypothetical protein
MIRLSLASRHLSLALALGLAQTVVAAQPDAQPGNEPGTFVPGPGGAAAPNFGRGDAPVYVPPSPRDLTPPAGAVPPATVGGLPSPGYRNYKEIPVFVPYSAREVVDPKDKTKGENLLESYFAPKFPTHRGPLHPTHGPSWAPGGDVDTGMRVGSPYYWSNHSYPAHGAGPVGSASLSGVVGTAGYGYAPGATPWVTQTGCNCNRGGSVGGVAHHGHVHGGYPQGGYADASYGAVGYGGPGYGSTGFGPTGFGPTGYGVGMYAPGTYAGGFASDPYEYHFGPGFHRHSDHAHYRFPYYSYRRPWYHPGHASYNRDTNYPW